MILSHDFTITAPMEAVFDALTDPALAGAVPGAAVRGHTPDGLLEVEVHVDYDGSRLGYRGVVIPREADREAGALAVDLSGRETKGRAPVHCAVAMRLRGTGGATTVSMQLDIDAGGRTARVDDERLARGVRRIVEGLAAAVSARLSATADAESAAGVALPGDAAPAHDGAPTGLGMAATTVDEAPGGRNEAAPAANSAPLSDEAPVTLDAPAVEAPGAPASGSQPQWMRPASTVEEPWPSRLEPAQPVPSQLSPWPTVPGAGTSEFDDDEEEGAEDEDEGEIEDLAGAWQPSEEELQGIADLVAELEREGPEEAPDVEALDEGDAAWPRPATGTWWGAPAEADTAAAPEPVSATPWPSVPVEQPVGPPGSAWWEAAQSPAEEASEEHAAPVGAAEPLPVEPGLEPFLEAEAEGPAEVAAWEEAAAEERIAAADAGTGPDGERAPEERGDAGVEPPPAIAPSWVPEPLPVAEVAAEPVATPERPTVPEVAAAALPVPEIVAEPPVPEPLPVADIVPEPQPVPAIVPEPAAPQPAVPEPVAAGAGRWAFTGSAPVPGRVTVVTEEPLDGSHVPVEGPSPIDAVRGAVKERPWLVPAGILGLAAVVLLARRGRES